MTIATGGFAGGISVPTAIPAHTRMSNASSSDRDSVPDVSEKRVLPHGESFHNDVVISRRFVEPITNSDDSLMLDEKVDDIDSVEPLEASASASTAAASSSANLSKSS